MGHPQALVDLEPSPVTAGRGRRIPGDRAIAACRFRQQQGLRRVVDRVFEADVSLQ